MSTEDTGNTVIMIDKVNRLWFKLAHQAEDIIDSKLSNISQDVRDYELKKKEILDNLKKNNLIVNTYYNVKEVLNYLTYNERPKSFASSKGEILFS